MGLHARTIVEEEFKSLRKDSPFLTERVAYRYIASTTVWDLIDRIQARIEKECIELPDQPDEENSS